MMIYVQKPLKLLCHENVPNYLIVFIGGFCDVVVGSLSRMAEEFPGFLDGATFVTAYYHWDGGGCGVFWDKCGQIATDLEFVRRTQPHLPIILVGHSYGSSCAVEVARRQSVQAIPLCLLTLDAVSRRQKNTRPKCVGWWGNAYLKDGGGIMDVVPRIGGRWGVCNGADVNLAFSGYCHDSKGRFYTHKRPAPLLYECPSEDGQSLFRLATEWLKGYQSAMKPVK